MLAVLIESTLSPQNPPRGEATDFLQPVPIIQCQSLTAAKLEFPELKRPHIHVLQQVLRTVEAAFVAMWERGQGFPRFKKRLRSFVFPQLNKEVIKGNRVNLPKIGWVRMQLSRPVPEGFIESYLGSSSLF